VRLVRERACHLPDPKLRQWQLLFEFGVIRRRARRSNSSHACGARPTMSDHSKITWPAQDHLAVQDHLLSKIIWAAHTAPTVGRRRGGTAGCVPHSAELSSGRTPLCRGVSSPARSDGQICRPSRLCCTSVRSRLRRSGDRPENHRSRRISRLKVEYELKCYQRRSWRSPAAAAVASGQPLPDASADNRYLGALRAWPKGRDQSASHHVSHRTAITRWTYICRAVEPLGHARRAPR